MKKIAFHIQKGGVGKTTISGNVAFLASKHVKTLIIDGDPQGNTSGWFLQEPPKYELADVLFENCSPTDAIVELSENFYIMPTLSIGGDLQRFASTKASETPFIFDDLCKFLEKSDFDLVIFDLNPGNSALEKAILVACDEVITPLQPETFSLDGVAIFKSFLSAIEKSLRVKIRHDKIVCNMVNNSITLHKSIQSSFKKIKGYKVFTIPQDTAFKYSQDKQMPVSVFGAKPETTKALDTLLGSILKEIKE